MFNDADTINPDLMSTNEYRGSHIGEYWIRRFMLDQKTLELLPSDDIDESIRLSRESVISFLVIAEN